MAEITIYRPPGAITLPDKGEWTHRFEIRSESSNRVYVIAQNKKTKKYGCSCPGWLAHRTCKHLTEGCGLSQSQIHGRDRIEEKKRQHMR